MPDQDDQQKKRPGRRRKGQGAPVAPAKPKKQKTNKTTLALQEYTRTYQIVQLLISGHSVSSIAEELGLEETTVNNMMSNALQHLRKDLEPILQDWIFITFGRTEIMIRSMMPHFEKAIREEEDPESKMVGSVRDIIKMQKEVMEMAAGLQNPQNGSGVNVTNYNFFSKTMDSNSPLYNMTMADEQRELFGGPQFKQLMDIPERDEATRQLDDIVEGSIVFTEEKRK